MERDNRLVAGWVNDYPWRDRLGGIDPGLRDRAASWNCCRSRDNDYCNIRAEDALEKGMREVDHLSRAG